MNRAALRTLPQARSHPLLPQRMGVATDRGMGPLAFLNHGHMNGLKTEQLRERQMAFNLVRFRNGYLQGHGCFIRLNVRFIIFGGDYLRRGSNFFHDEKNLFVRGKTCSVSDESQAAADQTFSVTDLTYSAMDLTFFSADQTFSSGGKPFPSRIKRIQSWTNVIRRRTKLRQGGIKLSALQTKPFPSQIKLSPRRTQPFQRPFNSRSLCLNLLESGVLNFSPVGASRQSVVWGGSFLSPPHSSESLPPTTTFTLTGACQQTRQPNNKNHG